MIISRACASLVWFLALATIHVAPVAAQDIDVSGNPDLNERTNDASGVDACGAMKASCESDLSTARNSLERMTLAVQQYETDVLRLQSELDRSKVSTADAEQSVEDITLELQQYKADMVRLRSELHLSKEGQADAEQKVEQAQLRLQDQNIRLNDLEKEKLQMEALKGEVIALKASFTKCDLDLNQSKSSVAQCDIDLKDSNIIMAKCNLDLNRSKSEIEEELKKKEESVEATNLLEKSNKACQVNLASVESSLTQHHQEREEIGSEVGQLDSSLKECSSHLVESESNYNGELQKREALDKSMARLKQEKDKQINGLKQKIDKGKKELEKQAKLLKSSQGRNRDIQVELSRSEKELRRIHIVSSQQYCNATKIQVDFQRKMEKVNDNLVRNLDSVVSSGKRHGELLYEQASPHLNTVRRKITVQASRLEPHVIAGKEKAQAIHQTHLAPHLTEMVSLYKTHGEPFMDSTVLPMYDTYGAPVRIRSQEAAQSIRLSLISALELTSDVGREYTEGLKQAQKRESEGIKIPHDSVIDSLTALNKNAEKIIDSMLKVCVVSILLIIFKRPLRPLIYVFVLLPLRFCWFISKPFVVLPLRLLWFLCPLRLILRTKAKGVDKIKNESKKV